ncbi:hypothetical protein MPL1032_140030 [Mesorhizobium plurifarium]|uniref:Uncharacterized protein n=1 Tax=Mesorhizobium plurifarium TaxID=69974 RepID=A0A0K2VRW1_MESPL|nr:hypothetical protein MPL1032_140030 [Mesorhizobium plurifarium]
MHHLDEIAGGVFGRQQAERRAAAGLDAVDMAMEGLFRIGVYGDVDGLARPHQVELRLLEIGFHPDVVGHEHHQHLAGLRVGAFRRRDVGGMAGDRRRDGRAREGDPGLVLGGLGLAKLGLGALALRLQNRHLAFRGLGIGVGGIERCLILAQGRSSLLRLLLRRRALGQELTVSLVLGFGEFERRLRLRHLFFGGIDLGVLRLGLGPHIGNIGTRRNHAGFRLFERGLIITVVDAQKHGAGFDRLVVGDGDIDDASGNFRADRHRAGVDEGVVGPFILPCVDPPDDHGRDDQQDEDGDDRRYIGMAFDEAGPVAVGRAIIRLRILRSLVVALVFHALFVARRPSLPIGPGPSPRFLGGSGFALFSVGFCVQGNGSQNRWPPRSRVNGWFPQRFLSPNIGRRPGLAAVSPPSSRHPPSGLCR